VDKWIWAAVRWEMEKRRLNERRCSWPVSAEFVKDCATRKRKMNNVDEIIFLNGIRPFLLRALVYKHTIRRYATRESALKYVLKTSTWLFAICSCKNSSDLIVLPSH